MEHFRVIIIGAGPAGFAAGAKLLENKVKDILILEAENRIGGRVFTSEIGGNQVEVGAEWIHGEKDNVVYELASKFGLTANITSKELFSDTSFFKTRNREIEKDISRPLCYLYQTIIYSEPENMKPLTGSLGDYFMRKYKNGLEELRKEIDIPDSLSNEFAEIFEKWENLIDASDSWFETSLPGHYEYWECDGNPVTNWKGNGYRTLFDLLEVSFGLVRSKPSVLLKVTDTADTQPSSRYPWYDSQRKPPYGEQSLNVTDKIKLNKRVKRIVWRKNEVPFTPNVVVECEDGTKYSSDHVLTTISIGVLKEKAQDMYLPSLSRKKLNTISALGFGTVDKLFLKFSYPWWEENKTGFAFLWSEEDKKTDTTGWISGVIAFHPVHPESHVLRGWVVGEAAHRMELLTDEEVLTDCMHLFDKFLGFKYKIPRAESVLRSAWFSNPHFRGSYSCRLLESDRMDVWASDLREPECNEKGTPVLLFAGEATHDHYYSTVHGAVESGRREADRLLQTTWETRLQPWYDVIIIGAGMSGLAAAKTLYEGGVTNILILEAQDTPGGRIKSMNINGDWIELGAQWIHGDRNEMFEICKKHDLVTEKYSQEGQGLYLRENGDLIDEKTVTEVDDLIKTVLENCEEYITHNGKIPLSIGQELLKKFEEYLKSSDDSEEVKDIKTDLFFWHVRFQLIDNSCDDLNNLSAKAWGLYRFCGGNDYVNFKNGYQSLVDVMLTYIPGCEIRYSTPVTGVHWNEQVDALVNGNAVDEDFSNETCAKVVCNNVSFDTDYVIMTSSIGYLKNNHENIFRPSLPGYLTQAIDSLGYGVLGKIFLIYKKPWWEPEVKGFQLVWSHKRKSWHWGVDMTGFDVIIDGRPILLGWVSGDGARTIETMEETDIATEATEILQTFTGNRNIPLPDRVVKSEWFGNEFILGGYSHITVDYDKNGIDGSNLSIPVYTTIITENQKIKKPTILLAGEAVHQSHFSTVHGAYESGVRQARVVLGDIKSRRP